MNKAFMKDPEPAPPCCPPPHGCGGPGVEVSAQTLAAQLATEQATRFAQQSFYCPQPGCTVAYFDGWGAWVGVDALSLVTHPKNPDGPVCACLGVGEAVIRDEALSGSKATVREVVARARSADAECVRRAPDGTSCEAAVRRVFLKFYRPGSQPS